MRTAIRSSVLFFLTLTLMDCSPASRSTDCLYDSECDRGERCLDGACVVSETCQTDEECRQDERCEDERCVTGNRCQTDSDCQDPTPTCNLQVGYCVACQPDCQGRECGPDGCDGSCAPGCSANQICDAAGQCQDCQPECGPRQCGPDPVCGLSCGECASDESCNLDGQCGHWCQLGNTLCTNDGYGYKACGPDPDNPGQNSYGPRIPCILGDVCQAGRCIRAGCLETELIVLLDRSSSMLAGETWDWVVSGLLEKLYQRQERNYFGYREFPLGGGCSVGDVLAMRKRNAYAIKTGMTVPRVDSATPIAAALQGLVPEYGDPNDGQAVVLISDGDETCAKQVEALSAAASLFRSGIWVSVLAVTQTANKTFLDQLAAAGGTQSSRLVTDRGQLVAALEDIFLELDACRCFAGDHCHDEQVWTCSADELSYSHSLDCPLGCNPDRDACQTCTPGEEFDCLGDEVWVCRDDGLDFEFSENCPLGCMDGLCQLCEEDDRICRESNQIWRCSDDRKDYVHHKTCPVNCINGMCQFMFWEDFEDQDFSDWVIESGTYTREIVEGGANGTGYCLSLTRSSL